jgi:hypothetical protein
LAVTSKTILKYFSDKDKIVGRRYLPPPSTEPVREGLSTELRED